MKPLDVRLRESAKQNRILLDVIEKDYAQSYVLAGLMSRTALRDTLVFKGGTALKKMFFGSYRFSEDLDFSAIHAPNREELEEIISSVHRRDTKTSGNLRSLHGGGETSSGDKTPSQRTRRLQYIGEVPLVRRTGLFNQGGDNP